MASLEEPFVLSSYAIDNAEDAWKVEVSALVYAPESNDEVSAKSLGKKRTTAARSIAVHTVQRSGVHLVDLAEQAPLSSFTVSPSTVFTTKAVSVSSPSTEQPEAASSTSTIVGHIPRIRRTFATVQQDSQYELWCWQEHETQAGSAAGEPVKQTLALPERAVALDVTSVIGNLLVCLEDGMAILLNFQLEELARTQLPSQHINRIRTSDTLSPQALASLGFKNAQDGTIAFAIATLASATAATRAPKEKKTKRKSLPPTSGAETSWTITVLAVNTTAKQIASVASVRLDGKQIVDAVFVGSTLSIATLSKTGHFATYALRQAGSSTQRDLAGILTERQAAPLPLTAIVQKSLELSAEKLNHSQGSLLSLNSNSMPPGPSPFVLLVCPTASTAEALQLLLVDTQYGLILAEQQATLPGSVASRAVTVQSDAYTVALGCTPGRGKDAGSSTTATRRVLVHSVPCSVPTHSTLADLIGTQALTQSYLASSASALAAKSKLAGKDASAEALLQDLQNRLGGERPAAATDVKAAEAAYRAWHAEKKASEGPQLSTNMVRRLLELAVSPARPTQPLASEIVSSLVSQGLAADSSLPSPGLTAAVLAKEDWSTVMVCLNQLKDIPEASLINALRSSCHTQKVAPHNVLRVIVRSPVTSAELRNVLRTGLGAEEVEMVLHILKGWLQFTSEDTVPRYGKAPSLDYIVPFTQAMLDAHLVTMLQSRTLHPLLHSISRSLYGEIEYSASILSLRGPLAEISRIHQLQVQEEKERKARMKKLGAKPGKKLKKLKDDPEERWKAKKKSQENTMLVGDYALEEFLL